MKEQLEFAAKLNDLVELSLDQENVIFEDQLFDIFPEVKEDANKLSLIKAYLSEKKIGINEKLSFEERITEDEKNYLDFYLEDLNEIEPLSSGEREAFMLSAMAGDESACAKIIEDSLKSVVDIAKLYAGQGVLLEDLIGEGNLAIMGAISLLGSAENAKEAEAILTGQVMDAMQDLVAKTMDEDEAEDKLVDKVNKVSEAAKSLSEDLGRKVTIDELMLEFKFTRAMIEKALKLTDYKIEEIDIPEDLK